MECHLPIISRVDLVLDDEESLGIDIAKIASKMEAKNSRVIFQCLCYESALFLVEVVSREVSMDQFDVVFDHVAERVAAVEAVAQQVPTHVQYLDCLIAYHAIQYLFASLALNLVPLQEYLFKSVGADQGGKVAARSARYAILTDV